MGWTRMGSRCIFIYILISLLLIMDDPEFVAQAVKYYKAVLESKKKAWKKKNPEPKPRGRPKKVAEGASSGLNNNSV
jgi:hypothetical protein